MSDAGSGDHWAFLASELGLAPAPPEAPPVAPHVEPGAELPPESAAEGRVETTPAPVLPKPKKEPLPRSQAPSDWDLLAEELGVQSRILDAPTKPAEEMLESGPEELPPEPAHLDEAFEELVVPPATERERFSEEARESEDRPGRRKRRRRRKPRGGEESSAEIEPVVAQPPSPRSLREDIDDDWSAEALLDEPEMSDAADRGDESEEIEAEEETRGRGRERRSRGGRRGRERSRAEESEGRPPAPRSKRVPEPEDEEFEEESDELAELRPGHKGIPTWDDAIGVVVKANIEARTRRPEHRSRPSGGREGQRGREGGSYRRGDRGR
ncbi:MAG: hypothetical protein ACOY3P_09035 [Planctomycetota bacterium]